MKYALCLIPLVLTACTTAREDYLQSIKDGVDSRITYKHYYSSKVVRVGKDEKAEGNCMIFAANYLIDTLEPGGAVKTCTLRNGEPHAFYMTRDGYVLDNRQKWVGRYEDVGCK